jgi:hypothetical protein
MKQEKFCRLLFVSAACALSFPWLTPCVGIWASAAVNGAHDSITKRNAPLNHLPDTRLKEWAEKPLPQIAILPRQEDSTALLVSDEEVSPKRGGKDAPKPGTIIGKGASALVDGVTYTLTWADPFTWVSGNTLGMEPTKPRRRLVVSESPFVMIEAHEIRYVSERKTGNVRLAKASNAKVTVITPDGAFTAHAGNIHYRGPSQEMLLEQPCRAYSETQNLSPAGPDSFMRLNFVKCGVSSAAGMKAEKRTRIDTLLLQKPSASR